MMKIGDRIFVRGYIDEIRKDTVIVRNDGGYFGTIPSEVITGELPSAQPERESAEWVKNDNGTYSCSKCKSWIPKEQRYYARFCLYCGAKMDGGKE